jgi:hypothetical protein
MLWRGAKAGNFGTDGPMGAQFANAPQLTTVRAGRKYLGVGCGCSLGSVEFARGQADQLGRYVFVAVRAVHWDFFGGGIDVSPTRYPRDAPLPWSRRCEG